MKLKISHLSLFGAALLVFYVTPAKNLLAESTRGEQNSQIAYSYPNNFVETYIQDCVAVATDHLETEDARKLCACTLKKFQNDYSYEQYKKLSEEEKQDVGMSCFDEMDAEA